MPARLVSCNTTSPVGRVHFQVSISDCQLASNRKLEIGIRKSLRLLCALLTQLAPCRALPFCHLRIRVVRCLYPNRWKCTQIVPTEPKTIGEHIKKRRLALHLLQADLAKRFGVHCGSIQSWEGGVTEPAIRHLQGIIEFLGYDPGPESVSELTQVEVVRLAKVDAVRLWRYERNRLGTDTRFQQIREGLVGVAREVGIWRRVELML